MKRDYHIWLSVCGLVRDKGKTLNRFQSVHFEKVTLKARSFLRYMCTTFYVIFLQHWCKDMHVNLFQRHKQRGKTWGILYVTAAQNVDVLMRNQPQGADYENLPAGQHARVSITTAESYIWKKRSDKWVAWKDFTLDRNLYPILHSKWKLVSRLSLQNIMCLFSPSPTHA